MSFKISHLVQSQGISAEVLAEKLGIGLIAVDMILNGKIKPGLADIPKLVDILNVDVEDIMSEGDYRKYKAALTTLMDWVPVRVDPDVVISINFGQGFLFGNLRRARAILRNQFSDKIPEDQQFPLAVKIAKQLGKVEASKSEINALVFRQFFRVVR